MVQRRMRNDKYDSRRYGGGQGRIGNQSKSRQYGLFDADDDNDDRNYYREGRDFFDEDIDREDEYGPSEWERPSRSPEWRSPYRERPLRPRRRYHQSYDNSDWDYGHWLGPLRSTSIGRWPLFGSRDSVHPGREHAWDEQYDRRHEGQHYGRGPKNWRRSDASLTEKINESLTDDSWIDASNLEVSVKNGEVTLTGYVDSRQAKRYAEDLVGDISGVTQVHNQLRVEQDVTS